METHLRMNPSSTGLTDQQRAKEPHGWYGKHSWFTSPYPGDYQAGVDGPAGGERGAVRAGVSRTGTRGTKSER